MAPASGFFERNYSVTSLIRPAPMVLPPSRMANRCPRSMATGAIRSMPTETLSPREREILDLLSKGYMNKEIADALSIAFQTVHTHVRNIYDKLHVRSRTQAVAKYLRPR